MIQEPFVKLIITALHRSYHIIYVLFFIVLLHLLLATAVQADINANDRSAFYTGPISAEQNSKFFSRVRGQKITRLVISSSGGEVEAGVQLGRWVYDNRVDVVVQDHCLSSCANYVFPAGRHKTIKQDAVVAWHGNYHHLLHSGLWRDEVPLRMRRYDESRQQATDYIFAQVERLVVVERDFFQLIGVDEYLCWIGKQEPYNVADYYFMSSKDMARFGVDNVKLPGAYQDTDVSAFKMSIVYIQLIDQPEL